MRLLLDTHAFLWMDAKSSRLPAAVVDAIDTPGATVFLSVASVWEIQIKSSAGKLNLGRPLDETIRAQREAGLHILPVTLRHVFALDRLPDHHRDPFDRLLIAQAIEGRMTLVTCDPQIARYAVSTLW